MSDDSFKNAPVSLGERRADKSRNAGDWSPREALVALLRDIDNGLQVDALVVCYRIADEKGRRSTYSQSVPDCLTALGLLHRGMHLIQSDA